MLPMIAACKFPNKKVHPLVIDLLLALWVTVFGNIGLWQAISSLPDASRAAGFGTIATLILIIFAALEISFLLLFWGPWRRLLGTLVLVISAATTHYMLSYGIVIDPTMIENVIHTDMLEVQGLMNWRLLSTTVLLAVIPAIYLWKTEMEIVKRSRLIKQKVVLLIIATSLLMLSMALGFQGLSALMRNHKSLRYMINPFNSVYGLVVAGIGETTKATSSILPVGLDAKISDQSIEATKSPILILVIGETARASNFGLGGYKRDTTPRLKLLQANGELTYFNSVEACGTSTQVSVPCMFSRLGRSGLDLPKEENLLDLLYRAGLAVFWLDNQSGCKGVCDRIPSGFAKDLVNPGICPNGECQDSEMVSVLPSLLGMLDNERKSKGTVIVMHQMGSHGPSYFKRSTIRHKLYLPECDTNALGACDKEHIVNAYDNSIVQTDSFLANTIDWLKIQNRPSALLYASDHGESLGEKGIFLHGMPNVIAPDEQTKVPMFLWTSMDMKKRLQLNDECMKRLSEKNWSHDNLFHTASTLIGVSSKDIESKRNMLAECSKI